MSDEETLLVAPDLTLVRDDTPQRDHESRESFNGPRWIESGRFEAIAHDRRERIRPGEWKTPELTAVSCKRNLPVFPGRAIAAAGIAFSLHGDGPSTRMRRRDR